MNKLALFDLDKTLITGNMAHEKAFAVAFQKVYGIKTGIDVIQHSGKTDQQIVFEVLATYGFEEPQVEDKLQQYLKTLEKEFQALIEDHPVEILDGVVKLLQTLGLSNGQP